MAFAFLVGWGFGRSERGCSDGTFREGPTRTQMKWYGSNGPPPCPRPPPPANPPRRP